MRTHPQHHDGVGTDASLHAFMHSLGHEQSATPAVALPPARVPSYRPASRDVGRTVRRLRARGITPPVYAPISAVEAETGAGWGYRVMVWTPAAIFAWLFVGVVYSYLAGRFG